ncbi:MAG: undecaprenyl/decaprenyl-phosphate alpha-N-acetylglucosaminyl 1-phosphate transferase [bacterium]|nr:undecaprenyl/decaprenyl-phosphate alpha-N-acetylglucosaminyl 1-phosphate transferase [bacterium]
MNSFALEVSTFVVALATTLFSTPLVRRIALKLGIVALPGGRNSHPAPTARGGGIAVFMGFAFALFVVMGLALSSHTKIWDRLVIRELVGLLFGGTLIFLIGVWDDAMDLPAKKKLLGQSAVAIVSMLYGFIIPGVSNPFDHDQWVAFPLWVGIPLTLFWYLGMMNAMNFIDGLDGLLAGITAIAGICLYSIAVIKGHALVALLMAALVGGALGFLPYNFNPAKIFLGDAGSLFIGYVFATVSIIGVSKLAISISLVVPLIVLALPVLDTAAAILRRMRRGTRVFDADRGHVHHVLVFRFGLGVRQAVILLYAVCFVLGVAAFLISGGPQALAHHVRL